MNMARVAGGTMSKTYYPQCDEVDYSEEYCPNCGHECFSRSCSDCGGEGGHDGYEEDPLWYDEGDLIPCDWCRGIGYFHWCPRCGWDMLLPEHYNTPERRGLAIARFDPRLVTQLAALLVMCLLFSGCRFPGVDQHEGHNYEPNPWHVPVATNSTKI